MYTGTYTVTATAVSVRDALNAALAAAGPEVPAIFSGRCMQVILIASAITVLVSSRSGTPPAGNAVALPAGVPVSFVAPSQNQISIDEIFLSGSAGTVGIMVLVD